MDLSTLKSNVRGVTSEVLKTCRDRGYDVDEFVAAVFALRCEIQGKWKSKGVSLSETMDPTDISAVAETAAACLMAASSTTIANVKMQVTMEKAFQEQKQLIENEHKEKGDILDSLARGICATKDTIGDSKYTEFHQKNYTNIVLGIWLYNEYKGVARTPAAPSVTRYIQQAQNLLHDAQEQRTRLQNTIESLERAHRRVFSLGDQENASRLQDSLVYMACATMYCEKLEDETLQAMELVRALKHDMDDLLSTVHEIVGKNATVPKDDVYPIFDKLGRTHRAVADEQRLLVAKTRLQDALAHFVAADMVALQVEEDVKSIPGAEFLVECDGPDIPEDTEAAEAIQGTIRISKDDLDQTAFAFNGFCPVSFVRRQGVPISHNPDVGFVKFQDKVYSFFEPVALHIFASNPRAYIEGVKALAMEEPLLLQPLGLSSSSPLFDVARTIHLLKEPLQCCSGTQTPTHFVETYIDKEYEWNVWALRRRALSLADLRGKATHSCQTNLSHFKRESQVQVWKPKQASTQTHSNKAQTMPKNLRYIAGLRGAPDVKMSVVSLELDIGQTHQY
ncbi:hypothetical protein BSKO_09179 [Bryopsis sp. KO-2023]|nr:hypothetical protein BSKO_09179 [Bryopsis sp. KO-2023]